MKVDKQPRFRRLLANDTALFISFVLIWPMWLLFLMTFVFAQYSPAKTPIETGWMWNVQMAFLGIALGMTLTIGLLSGWRLRVLRGCLANASIVEATVTEIYFDRKRRGRINYQFEWQGEKREGDIWALSGPHNDQLKKRDAVTIVVGNNNPNRTFLYYALFPETGRMESK